MSSAVARMKSSGSKFQRRPGSHSSPPPGTKRDRSNTNRWVVLIIVAAAQLMVVLDATIVNVALPHAQSALHISDSNRQWVVTAYSLAFGGLLLLGGRIADYTGRRRTFLIGLIGFAGASAVGGIAQSGDMLFAARACQGAFAALLAPSALSILSTTFKDGPDRVKAFAVYGGVSASGAAIGLLVGGVLTQYLSWRWTLLVNTPIAIVAVLAGLRYVPDSRAEGKTRYDIPGAATVTLGLVSLVYGCTKASTDGWGSTTTLSFLGAGVALLVCFVIVEMRSSHPLLPLKVVLDRNRGGANLVAAAIGAAIVGAFVFLIYYMQGILGYSPVKTGLASVPISLAIAPAVMIAAPPDHQGRPARADDRRRTAGRRRHVHALPEHDHQQLPRPHLARRADPRVRDGPGVHTAAEPRDPRGIRQRRRRRQRPDQRQPTNRRSDRRRRVQHVLRDRHEQLHRIARHNPRRPHPSADARV